MLALRPIRRFWAAAGTSIRAFAYTDSAPTTASSAGAGNRVPTHVSESKPLGKPALFQLKDERNPEKLFNLFKANAHNKLVIEDRFIFEDVVSRLAGARRFDHIEHLLEHQKTLPQGRREGFIVRIIMLYGKAGMIKHAVDTFHDMHLYGCRRTVKSFNAALKVLSGTRDLVAIEEFLREVPWKYGVEMDIFSVNIVIKAFCELGVLDKAYIVMVEMGKLGITPDVITYTTLISAFYKKRRWEIGNGLWNLMVLKGCQPNLPAFNVRVQFLATNGRAWEANKLLLMMPHIGITPDEVTYNLVIKGFFLAGYLEMAERVYHAFCRTGCKPNLKIYQTMIHYFCKQGEYDKAYNMCKDCMQRNLFPSIDSICALLEGLLKTGKHGKANGILMFARKRVPPFSVEQLETLKSIWARVNSAKPSK